MRLTASVVMAPDSDHPVAARNVTKSAHRQPEAESHTLMGDTRKLCQWHRALSLGTSCAIPRRFAHYQEASIWLVRRYLVDLALDAWRDNTIDNRAIDTWIRFYGFDGRPLPLPHIAKWHQATVSSARRAKDGVTRAIALRIDASGTLPATRDNDHHDERRADRLRLILVALRAEAAIEDDPPEPMLAALEAISSDQAGQPQPRGQFSGPASRAERAETYRRKRQAVRRIERELDRPAGHPQRVPIDREVLSMLAQPLRDAAEAAVGDAPDLDALRAIAQDVHRLYWNRDAAVIPIVQLACNGFTRFPKSPDPLAEATLWELRARLWRESEHIGVVTAYNRIRSLLGATHPLALQAASDTAITLRAHNQLATARDTIAHARAALSHAQIEPQQARAHRVSLAVVDASISAWIPDPDGFDATQTNLRQILEALDRFPDEPMTAWDCVVHRRIVQIDVARQLADQQKHGYRHFFLHPRTMEAIEHAASAAARSQSLCWQMSWHLTQAKIALHKADPDAFADHIHNFAALYNREPWYPNLVADVRAMSDQAALRGWHPPDVTRLPHSPSTLGWDASLKPLAGAPRVSRLLTV